MKKNILLFTVVVSLISCKLTMHEKEKSEAYDALQFFGTMNAYPGIDIPDAAYGKAYNFYKANYQSNASRTAAVASWQSIGPNNVGGRTISIAIDPVDTNIIWLGSASGGLWKSTVGGIGTNAWQYISTGFPVLGVATIAINPQNTNEMYIGTGETYDYGTSENGIVIRTTRGSNGIGILKSADGGVTWTHALNWLYNQRRTVWDIIINSLNPATVFAGTTEGVLKSTDAGATWTTVLNEQMIMDLQMDPADTTILYAGVGNLTSPTHGIYKSTNAGTTWAQLTNGLPPATNDGRISIGIYKNNSNILMAHITDAFNTVGLYRSLNKGVSWSAVSTGNNIAGVQGWYSDGLLMKDNDSSEVYIGGQLLWASTTFGTNTFQYTNYDPANIQTVPWTDMHGIISNPFDADKIYLLTDAGLYRSNNFGVTWYWCADGYVVSQFYHGSFSTTDSLIGLGGLQDRNTQLYSGSLYWDAHYNGDGTTTAIDPTDDFYQYTSSQYLNIEQSTDQGQTFSNYVFGGFGAAFDAPYILAPSNNLAMYAGDESINKIDLISFNSVTNPPELPGQSILSIAVSYQDEDKIYFTFAPTAFGDPAKVYKSLNAGVTASDITSGLPDRYPRDIQVNPLNDNIAYVVFSGFGTGHIYKTNNGGTAWTDISASLPDIPFHSLLISPNDTSLIFAGSDLGVFYSVNSGTSWQTLNNGFPDAIMIFDFEYSPSDNKLVAFSHGHGVYKIDLDQVINTGVESLNTASQNISLFPNPVKDHLLVKFNFNSKSEIKFEVFDERGKLVYSMNKEETKRNSIININCSSFSKGIYFLKIKSGNVLSVKKFVKI
ncbi:MAG TPA: T9SS type A sorting domain-containing protein [Bacteroidia bacterium]|nr:T9SS type A sorting domain-containing protein [Bacteroidia bacterium]